MGIAALGPITSHYRPGRKAGPVRILPAAPRPDSRCQASYRQIAGDTPCATDTGTRPAHSALCPDITLITRHQRARGQATPPVVPAPESPPAVQPRPPRAALKHPPLTFDRFYPQFAGMSPAYPQTAYRRRPSTPSSAIVDSGGGGDGRQRRAWPRRRTGGGELSARPRYRILDRNWRCAEGEIDIVAVDRRTFVVCEVKTRSGTRYGTPADAVGYASAGGCAG